MNQAFTQICIIYYIRKLINYGLEMKIYDAKSHIIYIKYKLHIIKLWKL